MHIDSHEGTERQCEDNCRIFAGFFYEITKCMIPFYSTSSAKDVSNSSIVKFVTASVCSYNQISNQIKDDGCHSSYRTQFDWK